MVSPGGRRVLPGAGCPMLASWRRTGTAGEGRGAPPLLELDLGDARPEPAPEGLPAWTASGVGVCPAPVGPGRSPREGAGRSGGAPRGRRRPAPHRPPRRSCGWPSARCPRGWRSSSTTGSPSSTCSPWSSTTERRADARGRPRGRAGAVIIDPGPRWPPPLPMVVPPGEERDLPLALTSDCDVLVRPLPAATLVVRGPDGAVRDQAAGVPDLDRLWGRRWTAGPAPTGRPRRTRSRREGRVGAPRCGLRGTLRSSRGARRPEPDVLDDVVELDGETGEGDAERTWASRARGAAARTGGRRSGGARGRRWGPRGLGARRRPGRGPGGARRRAAPPRGPDDAGHRARGVRRPPPEPPDRRLPPPARVDGGREPQHPARGPRAARPGRGGGPDRDVPR